MKRKPLAAGVGKRSRWSFFEQAAQFYSKAISAAARRAQITPLGSRGLAAVGHYQSRVGADLTGMD
ncbi:MAG: hypothetical protein H6633_11675 [Anaerolineales bacterium]|nr:hypothetical protein [Anaerolineales bacterium]